MSDGRGRKALERGRMQTVDNSLFGPQHAPTEILRLHVVLSHDKSYREPITRARDQYGSLFLDSKALICPSLTPSHFVDSTDAYKSSSPATINGPSRPLFRHASASLPRHLVYRVSLSTLAIVLGVLACTT